jgi:5-methylcytosine-specific restriction endonuclease McrA
MRKLDERTAAIEQGRSRYFTGIPCVNGHLAERKVVGHGCVECHRLNHTRRKERVGTEMWREKHREASARHVAKQCAEMGEEAWLAKERARCIDYNRRNAEARRASARASMAKLYQQDPKRFSARAHAREKQLLIDNPVALRLSQAARRAAYNVRKAGTASERGLTAIVRRVWDKTDGKCAACAATGKLELDHVVAVINGGTNDESNLQFLCKTCNCSKGKRDYDMWLNSRPLAA